MNNNEVISNNNDIMDIDLSVTRKKRFRIDGDNNRILELNTSDMMIVKRLNVIYPKLQKLAVKASNELELDSESEDFIAKAGEAITSIDTDMRKLVDELFDAEVSKVAAPDGSMYDLFNGKFRFEHIIDTISGLYENNFNAEYKKISERITKHTGKYTKKR